MPTASVTISLDSLSRTIIHKALIRVHLLILSDVTRLHALVQNTQAPPHSLNDGQGRIGLTVDHVNGLHHEYLDRARVGIRVF